MIKDGVNAAHVHGSCNQLMVALVLRVFLIQVYVQPSFSDGGD